ncbi:MAG: AIPR family protein [Bacteroidetes bacterium]|nr:AIPR family protein [Bacteroidota bacterium]
MILTILYDYNKSYKELVFPMITSTFYNKEKLIIKIKVDSSNSNRAKSNIKTSYKDCAITMLLVPVKEIGRIMSIYKNSILKYNPRSFLSLSNNNVNKNIATTIKFVDSNDFALFNNGVTMLASEAVYSDTTAIKGEDQLLLTNPQIINGGQTAYTLSQIYEECQKNGDFSVLEEKSVVLKVITLAVSTEEKLGLELIEKISKATNYQTPVEINDRISNDEKQIMLQKIIFDKYGYYYERKKGEYAEGITKNYIYRDLIIEKTEFMRILLSSVGLPNQSRRVSLKVLFSKKNLDKIEISNISKYFYAFKCYEYLKKLVSKQKRNWDNIVYGNALRYGTYATIYATILVSKELDLDNLKNKVDGILNKWQEFENWIRNREENHKYFKRVINEDSIVMEMNYSGYYRGTTINKNLYDFFGSK